MSSEDERWAMARAPELPPGPRRALIIATSQYEDARLGQLRSPGRDAQDFAAVLADPEIGNFTVEQLLDQPGEKIRRGIAKFLLDRQSDETLLVYVSCHGLQDSRGNLFFAATDTDTRLVIATAIRATDLLVQFDDCAAQRQILIYDCCFSGAFGDAKRGRPNLGRQLGIGGPGTGGQGREVLTASNDTEYSYEGEPLGDDIPGSVYTTGLVEGLRDGAADADQDGYVTVEEAHQYAFDYVRGERSPQTPQRNLFRGQGTPIVLARSRLGRRIELPPLPDSLRHSLESPYSDVRITAVYRLARWLTDPDVGQNLAAGRQLRAIASGQDIPAVRDAARRCLEQGPITGPVPTQPTPDWVPDHVIALLEGNAAAVYDVAFRPDGAQLVTAGHDGTVRLWDTRNARETQALQGHRGRVRGAAFSPDGATVASAGGDWMVRLWDAADGRQTQMLRHPDVARRAVFSPDGGMLASCGEAGVLTIWDLKNVGRPRNLRGHRKAVRDVAFSPDGKVLASAAGDTMVRLWDVTGGWRPQLLRGHADWVRGVAFSPDSSTVASCGNDMTVRLWDVATGSLVSRLTGHTAEAHSVAFSPDGRLLASGGADGVVRIWKTGTWKQLRVLEGHAGVVYRVAFSPTERLLASAGEDRTVRLWT